MTKRGFIGYALTVGAGIATGAFAHLWPDARTVVAVIIYLVIYIITIIGGVMANDRPTPPTPTTSVRMRNGAKVRVNGAWSNADTFADADGDVDADLNNFTHDVNGGGRK